MKAYEFPARVTPEGKLELPEAVLRLVPTDQVVRVIVLVSEPSASDEEAAWCEATADQFLAGYSEADSIYDKL